eukprot:gb/GECG01004025.1/.p1 GENE.gb/GECG01004025.1/~~gb/GECG01004025.1/.p1  ORF type:complete len:143 (+),score=2.42 gb/GECG01004025.1/:1-429(+)
MHTLPLLASIATSVRHQCVPLSPLKRGPCARVEATLTAQETSLFSLRECEQGRRENEMALQLSPLPCNHLIVLYVTIYVGTLGEDVVHYGIYCQLCQAICFSLIRTVEGGMELVHVLCPWALSPYFPFDSFRMSLTTASFPL